MEIGTLQLQDIINLSLKRSTDYATYRTHVSALVEANSTTGHEKTEALANYTKLNDKRMKRWDKTVKIPEALQQKILNYPKKLTLLVLTESWCGDAAHIIPVINKIAVLNPKIELKLVLRDENEPLMNYFLTNGGKAIPKVIALDNDKSVNFTYGPRPNEATQLVLDYKTKHGALTPEFKEDLQHWYNKNKGQAVLEDLETLLKL
jgi:thiol-disulfide isomerase/thioredoxin